MPEADLGHIHSISDGGFCVSQLGLRKYLPVFLSSALSYLLLLIRPTYTSNEGLQNRQGSAFFYVLLKCPQNLTYSSRRRVLGRLSATQRVPSPIRDTD